MLVKTFHGRSCTEALSRVRESLGEQAAILETRRGDTGVEVVAAAERPSATQPLAASTKPPSLADSRVPLELEWLSESLTDRGFTAFLAERICQAAQSNLDPAQLEERDTVFDYARTLLALWVNAGPASAARGTVVRALVGPSGVGKTSTAAKLAARDLVAGRGVALASADTRRLGGAEQLEQYAGVLGVSFHVVRRARDVDAARRAAGPGGIVYLDTPGIPRRDVGALEDLGSLLGAVRAEEVELLLAADHDVETLADTVQRFRPLRPNSVSATRTDEAIRRGSLVSALARARLPLRHIGNGPDVPNDLELADSRRLAAWALPAPEERA